ncbi:MAG: hypothetical protein B7733_02005 [Myxococcales bacterium FL481]|nr:MAG: hypothetical protein B7733_02005 [Myxococcales bacterium FL481]
MKGRPMQYFIYFTVDPDRPMTPPTPEGMAEMSQFMQDSMAQGIVVSTGQLGRTTTHITLDDGEISVTDGPFLESKELIPGYTVIEVASKQAAIEWASRLRRCMGNGTLRMSAVSLGRAET